MGFITKLKDIFSQLKEYESNFSISSYKLLNGINLHKDFKEKLFFEEVLSHPLPTQYYDEGQFGEYNITLFNENNISVQLYFMDSVITNIHSHPFEGAFMVLKGESVQSSYEFDKEEHISSKLIKGHLVPKDSLRLKEGDCVEIKKNTIHQILRLKDRNITLLIAKNYNTQNSQFFYPNIELKSTHISADISRKISMLSYFYKYSEDEAMDKIALLLSRLTLTELYELYGYIGQIITSKFKSELNKALLATIKKTDIDLYKSLEAHISFQLNLKKKFEILKELNRP